MAAPARLGKRLAMAVTWWPSFSASPLATVARGVTVSLMLEEASSICSWKPCGGEGGREGGEGDEGEQVRGCEVRNGGERRN